jgi:hypothetical protein
MREFVIASCAAAACSMMVSASEVSAQTKDSCSAYAAAVTSGAPAAIPVVPDPLLVNWKLAVSCLVPIIAAMKDSMKSDSVGTQTRAKFLSATGALRAMATRIGTAEEANNRLPPDKRNPNADAIAMFADEFHKAQTIDAISALTAGARSADENMRLSAILVLGNVIDEHYACVPLVQIFDPALDTAEYAVKARANLLGMLARMAPYVYKEDFANVRNVRAAIKVPRDDLKFEQTNLILQNIDQRLDAQTERSNRGVPLEREFKDRCVKYMAAYPPTDKMKANIKY